MIYFSLGVTLSERQKKELLEHDSIAQYVEEESHISFAEIPEELINSFIKIFPTPSKVRLTSIAPNETITIAAEESPERKSVIVFPLSENYAPFIAKEDDRVLEVPDMTCYAFNTTLSRTVENNETRRISLQLWYDMDIAELHRTMTEG